MTDSRPLLALITGAGRSGTSTLAGALHHAGLSVPGPYLGANESNPKGFYESRFAVRFHKELAALAGIHDMDARPEALKLMQEQVRPRHRAKLTAFVAKASAEHPQIVVKDPRSVWTQALWREAAADSGLDIGYLSMLRAPAETIGSRTTYYAETDDAGAVRSYQTFSLARWINTQLVSERETRGQRRTFVKYPDLLADWRQTLGRLATEHGFVYNTDLAAGDQHPNDEFIEPTLRRVRVTWDDLDVPESLRTLADEIWHQLSVLHDTEGTDPVASAALDDLDRRYRDTFYEAAALSHDAAQGAVHEARTARPAEQDAPAGDQRRVSEVGARELIGIAGRRVIRRLRR